MLLFYFNEFDRLLIGFVHFCIELEVMAMLLYYIQIILVCSAYNFWQLVFKF